MQSASEFSLVHAVVASPLGPLHLAACDEGLVHMLFAVQERPPEVAAAPIRVVASSSHPVLAHAARELDAYFAGALRVFTVPLAPRGTPFQQAVWRALVAIPFGELRAYRDIARTIGKSGAERAVGAANGKNRIGIIIPCHRVIGADGTLTGYAGGLDKKRWLLDLESSDRSSLQRDLFA